MRRRFVASDVVAGNPRHTADVCSFGGQLRQWRHRHNWSQRELGAATFFSREYVARIERGERRPTADFVARAEAALAAGGQLQHTFTQEEQRRHGETRPWAAPRPVPRRRGKITISAGRLRSAAGDVSTGERSSSWWTAFDELHRVLQDELEPVDADADVMDLEQQCADLAAGAGDESSWAEVLAAAALGMADAGALLQRPLPSDHAARLVAVVAQFAMLTGDALVMLGRHTRADEWYSLAGTVQRRAVMPPPGGELDEPSVGETAGTPDEDGSIRLVSRASALASWRASGIVRRPSGGGGHPAGRRVAPRWACRMGRCGCCGRSPPVQGWGMEATSKRDPSGSSTNVA
ncbi:helix-turn-helix domain-containing protein [Dactylosporangium sp. CA-139066]|uniref:helix-turn-helix domain-containing protein n=1 Tax=Dactylosporangium sp. CA-139066 TaxID=3239930 RepID=UPI003D8BCA5D